MDPDESSARVDLAALGTATVRALEPRVGCQLRVRDDHRLTGPPPTHGVGRTGGQGDHLVRARHQRLQPLVVLVLTGAVRVDQVVDREDQGLARGLEDLGHLVQLIG